MPGSKYDRFYIDEFVKSFPKQQDIETAYEEV